MIASALALLVLVAGSPPDAAPGPIPSEDVRPASWTPLTGNEILQLARAQAIRNSKLYFRYSFDQRTTDEKLDKDGKVIHRETRRYRVTPYPDGTERELLEKDGVAPPARLVKKQERRNEALHRHFAKQREKQERAAAKRARQSPAAGKSGSAQALPPGRSATAGAAPVRRERAAQARPVPAPLPAALAPVQPALLQDPMLEPPECDLADPASRVLPPQPRAPRPPIRPLSAPTEESRRQRESTSEYTLFELLSLTRSENVGTCRHEGRTVHVVAFEPPEGFDPLNPVERVVTGMAGTILVDVDEMQVLRADGRTVAPLKWGGGLVALKSARVVFEHRKVNDEVWLPSGETFEFESRVLMDGDRERTTNEYSNYREISVETTEDVGGIVDDGASAPATRKQ